MTTQVFEPVIVLTTTDSEEHAQHMAQCLVREHLAACVSYHGMRSVYRWENEIQHEQEFQVVIKANGSIKEKVMRRICELHNYDVPEILVLPIESGSNRYLSWMAAQF